MSPPILLAGQLAVVLLLAAALWDPAPPWPRAPAHLIVLLDESASSRASADAAWRALARALAARTADDRLSLVRFARTAAIELDGVPVAGSPLASPEPPRGATLSDRQTDIAAAVRAGLGLAGREPSPVLVLVSDGMATLGDTEAALAAAAAAGVPVLWWRPDVPAQSPDAWIARLSAPPRIGPMEPVTLTAVLGADAPLKADLLVGTAEGTPVRHPVELAPGQALPLAITVEVPGTGAQQLTVALDVEDRVPESNRRAVLVERDGPSLVALVSPHGERSTVAGSLRAAGWPLTVTVPRDFSPAVLEGAGVLAIEEVATADLSEVDWIAIERAVRVGGTGLLVLGGPGTFGAGSYRHSTLESLLPVLAESPRPQAPAAVVFAVDTSGSMGQTTAIGATRLALASRAVASSARSLTPADSAALVAFDADARTLLPLAPRADHAAALGRSLAVSASGGTRIAPAVAAALELFGDGPAEERLLVVATDGRFTDADQTATLAARIAARGVDVVAIAVGAEADFSTLEGLVAHGRSRLLRAADAVEVPALMEREIQARRNPVRDGPVVPRALRPLPFQPQATEWPPIAAMQVTRPRPGAEVYLATADGEPVLAEAFRGAGRVVALPAGLGVWATEWARWPEWGRFLGGLVQWTAASSGDPAIDLRIEDGPASIRVTVDATGDGGDWAPARPLPVAARDPDGNWHRVEARPAGPGRWTAEIATGPSGRYDLIAGLPGREQRRALIHDPIEELVPQAGTARGLEAFAARGLVSAWLPASPIPMTPPSGGARRALVGAAVAALGLLLVAERLWGQAPVRKPPASPRKPREPGNLRYATEAQRTGCKIETLSSGPG